MSKLRIEYNPPPPHPPGQMAVWSFLWAEMFSCCLLLSKWAEINKQFNLGTNNEKLGLSDLWEHFHCSESKGISLFPSVLVMPITKFPC